MYENARREVNWECNPPPGVIFHAASFDDSGNIRVADIWESEDQWKNFLYTRLMHYMQKAKAPPLKMKIFQIHNINALSGLDSYKVR
jgi:predicted phosphoadenosine phosphosulfate sulfurtransferase